MKLGQLVAELRARGVLTVAAGYVVVGYGIMEGAAFLLPRQGFPDIAVQIVIALVLFGFPIALLIAWRVKKDEQASTISPRLLTAGFLTIALLSVWLGFNAIRAPTKVNRQQIVLMMDSPHPSRVYDEETLQNSGSNADILNDLLRDLPIQRYRESISPVWHRDEEIRQLKPDLILIHLSGFCIDRCDPQFRRLHTFVDYMAATDTKFIIYSRFTVDSVRLFVRDMLGNLPKQYPELPNRIHLFSLSDVGTPHWKDPSVAAAMKQRVRQVLDLDRNN